MVGEQMGSGMNFGTKWPIPYDALPKGANRCFSWAVFLNSCDWCVVSLATASLRELHVLALYYYITDPPKSTVTHLTGYIWLIEYIVNSWNSYFNNYSTDNSKCQRQAWTTDLE